MTTITEVSPMKAIGSVVLVLMFGLLPACSPAARSRIGAAAAGAPASQTGTTKLMVFGGVDHRAYLGCLNCSQYASDSVFNEYGHYGSRYSSESIWNHYSEYGSAYSSYGACNAYATDPPVIVDSGGRFYGRLTLNTYHAQLGVGAKYYNWLKQSVCESN